MKSQETMDCAMAAKSASIFDFWVYDQQSEQQSENVSEPKSSCIFAFDRIRSPLTPTPSIPHTSRPGWAHCSPLRSPHAPTPQTSAQPKSSHSPPANLFLNGQLRRARHTGSRLSSHVSGVILSSLPFSGPRTVGAAPDRASSRPSSLARTRRNSAIANSLRPCSVPAHTHTQP
jgi:hypothetical protein